ncbi:MAG: RNA pseudouridine synthase [Bacteroidia bacterium]
MKSIRFKEIVIKESEDYIFLNKPSGIASLHERDLELPSIIEMAQKYCSDAQLCHRLDKETSGVLLIAKNKEAYRNASIQFEKRQVEKVYHAICDGIHSFKEQLIDLPLSTTRSGRSQVNSLKGKSCQTVVSTLQHFQHYTLVEAKPLSGRLHQIRAHLSAINAPIAADHIYHGKSPYLSKLKKNFSLGKYKEEQPMIKRVALHAKSIKLQDLKGDEILVEADYPKDFAVLLKQLDKFDKTLYSV